MLVDPLLTALLFFAAVLNSAVGQAGASTYLAAMALVGVPQATMKPTALALNVFVASLVTTRFAKAGLIHWRALAPYAVTSIPLSFVGAALMLPDAVFRPLVGAVLLLAAARLPGRAAPLVPSPPPLAIAALTGAVIGLVSGLTGTGGGIFLTPVVLFAGWADTRQAAGMSAAFILVNSLAGFAVNLTSLGALPPELPAWLAVVGVGGLIGAELATRWADAVAVRFALTAVLVIAGLKLILSG